MGVFFFCLKGNRKKVDDCIQQQFCSRNSVQFKSIVTPLDVTVLLLITVRFCCCLWNICKCSALNKVNRLTADNLLHITKYTVYPLRLLSKSYITDLACITFIYAALISLLSSPFTHLLWLFVSLSYLSLHLTFYPRILSVSLSLSYCIPLLTPFSLPCYSPYCICVLNQHFGAVCRRPAEMQTMELIILPQILDLAPVPLLCCSIPPLSRSFSPSLVQCICPEAS